MSDDDDDESGAVASACDEGEGATGCACMIVAPVEAESDDEAAAGCVDAVAPRDAQKSDGARGPAGGLNAAQA